MQTGVDPLDGALVWSAKVFPDLQNESPQVYKSFNETSNMTPHEMTPNKKNLWTANLAKEKLADYLIGIILK